MNSPKWFLFALGLLTINAGAVVLTGYWRHAGADEPSRSETLENSSTLGDATVQPVATEAEKNPDQQKNAKPDSPLDAIPIPDSLPEIPSLADPESLKDDPSFQEFRRLFAKEEESWGAEPPLLESLSTAPQNQAYFEALHQRLETVEQLCSATRNIAQEAALHARNNRQDKSQELVRLTTQLRDIAAKLLVSEL